MVYYDEFQQLTLKLDHRSEKVHYDIIRFKVGLNKDISSRMTLHKFETVVEVFQTAMEIQKENKERYKPKAQAPS